MKQKSENKPASSIVIVIIFLFSIILTVFGVILNKTYNTVSIGLLMTGLIVFASAIGLLVHRLLMGEIKRMSDPVRDDSIPQKDE